MKKIILASKSPRRIEMLSKYSANIKIYSPETDETVQWGDQPQTTVMRLAFKKAQEVLSMCEEDGLIVSADTVVYLDRIMGKPSDYREGFEMIKALSGRKHKVFTGICICSTYSGKKVLDYEETDVFFNDLTDDEIARYLNTGEYIDKAGGYGIQGYGELLVKRIDGCYNNVKGLPLSRLNYLLKKHFSYVLL